MRRAERAVIRRLCGVSLRERKRSEELQQMVGVVEDIVGVVTKARLRWYGHVMRREESEGIRKVVEFEVSGAMPRGRPKMMWGELVGRNMREYGFKEGDWVDRNRWEESGVAYR